MTLVIIGKVLLESFVIHNFDIQMKLSIIIPCYNEARTLSGIVDSVLDIKTSQLDVEVIVVDDCSSDGSGAIAGEIASKRSEVRVVKQPVNMGKGAALRAGFMAATGDFVGIQDADNEYSPHDYLKMLREAELLKADVVYGSRYLQDTTRRVLRFWHSTMNRFLTLFSNAMSDLDITDMETCYKLFRREVIAEVAPTLRENRFGFEPEVTARIAQGMRKHGWRMVECAISYNPRSFSDGKKIGWVDGVRALWCILKYNLFCK